MGENIEQVYAKSRRLIKVERSCKTGDHDKVNEMGCIFL
jgi:hypothetical protein